MQPSHRFTTSSLPHRPLQPPCLRRRTCLSISDYKPSNSSLCLNDRPFICLSALSSYMTLMALTSCKPQQLAVWVHECVSVCVRVCRWTDRELLVPAWWCGSNPCLFCSSTRRECPTHTHTRHTCSLTHTELQEVVALHSWCIKKLK